MKKLLLLTLFIAFCGSAYSQLYPERRMIRQGNRTFKDGNYSDSEVSYLRAKQAAPHSFEAEFNLNDTYYKQGRFEEAARGFDSLGRMEVSPELRSAAYYNAGNSLFSQKKYQEALEAYKNALRQNPSDEQAKFNLAYTKKKIEDQKDEQKKDEKEKKEDKKDQQENKQDPKDQQDQQDQQEEPQDKQQKEQPQGGMNRNEAERMLNAVQNSEDNTRDKIEAEKVPVGARSNKNW